MKLDCRVVLVLKHPTENKVLLLRRAPHKKLFPNQITGIGGKAELEKGEAENLDLALWREFKEETKINPQIIADFKLRLVTLALRENTEFLLFWYTGSLKELPQDLSCNEGELGFYGVNSLPLADFTETAAKAIPFILNAPGDRIYNGLFKPDGSLVVN